MRNIIIKILFRLLKIPIASKPVDSKRMREWIGLQYPLQEFQNYIAVRNLHLLQMFGEGIGRDEDYWIAVGQRIELGRLLTEAKKNFAKSEIERKKKQDEAAKNKKS